MILEARPLNQTHRAGLDGQVARLMLERKECLHVLGRRGARLRQGGGDERVMGKQVDLAGQATCHPTPINRKLRVPPPT